MTPRRRWWLRTGVWWYFAGFLLLLAVLAAGATPADLVDLAILAVVVGYFGTRIRAHRLATSHARTNSSSTASERGGTVSTDGDGWRR